MKLRTKLIASFTSVIVMLLIIGVALQYFNNKIKDQVIDENRGAVQELEISGQMESELYQTLINSQYYLDEPYRATLKEGQKESTLSVENIKSNVDHSLKTLKENLDKVEKLFKSDYSSQFPSKVAKDTSLVILDNLKTRVDFYSSLIEQLLNSNESNFIEGKEFFTVTVEPYFRNNLLPAVEQFRKQIRMNLEQQVTQLDDRFSTYSSNIILATIIVCLFSILLAIFLYKSITIPIQYLATAAQDIGRGNLEKRIEVKTEDEIGQLGTSFNRMVENLNKITFSKEYVDDIIESMGDALIVTDEQARITKINSATKNLLGYTTEELIDQPFSIMLTGEDKEMLMSLNEHAAMENYETNFIQKNGDSLPVSLSKELIHNNDEQIKGLVCVASDISERKKSEATIQKSLKEKEILLSEIHHRVKNNLAVISGLLQMQIWETENEVASEALQDSQLRVKSIALVHEKLYQSENLSSIKFDKYIHELLKGIEKTYKNSVSEISFKTEIDPIVLNINQAIPCSLLLNELVVNAYKHAFKDRKKGIISIRLSEKNKNVTLIVEDDGVGLVEEKDSTSKKTLGMSLVKTLAQQLNGELDAHNNDGASFTIRFTLQEVT